jgi:uncharacterized membrane protein (UPF0136 family)
LADTQGASFHEVTISCPRCGQPARVVDGTYDFDSKGVIVSGVAIGPLADVAVRLLGQLDDDGIQQIRSFAERHALASFEEIERSAQAELPVIYSALSAAGAWAWMASGSGMAAATWLMLLLMVVEAMRRRSTGENLTEKEIASVVRREIKRQSGRGPSLNQRCPCGSGRKFKKCHGARSDL